MAICKFCGEPFQWGKQEDGKFVPLVLLGKENDLDRTFQDENGVLRAEYRKVCTNPGGVLVRVARLAKAVKSGEIIGKWTPDSDGVMHDYESETSRSQDSSPP